MEARQATFRAPPVHKLRQRVPESPRTAILEGRLPPGERLAEAELARQFEFSRGCVREGSPDSIGAGLVWHIYGALPTWGFQQGVPPAIQALGAFLAMDHSAPMAGAGPTS